MPAKSPKKEEPAAPAQLDKAYEPKAVEDRIYAAWEASGFFNPDNLPGKRSESFTIMMPPPNATGTLHIGHAMFMTLEDLMTRFHRMRGKAALWVPGTDHAAIATNAKVEKILAKEGKTKYDLGRNGFIERVKEYIAGSQGTIRKQIRKMGSSCDWSREAYTFDEPRSRAVREIFSRMFADGLIYRGNRIVNWCPGCQSTLADDEVEYKEEAAKLYYLKYGPFSVATTRPETKLGDTAVAVHPDDARYKKWHGKTFTVDFGIGPQEIRVITDVGVDMKFGSGVVGVTPAHSAVDFAMAEKNLLPVKKIIGEDGKMTALAGSYKGLTVLEAREKFIANLKEKGLLEKVEDITHNLSICYRSGGPVEPLTSRQWFVDVDRTVPTLKKSLKRMSLDVVRSKAITIVPDRFEKVYFNWMENLHDWCISRQIWFGHRIPVWYCQHCYVEDESVGKAGAEAHESRRHQGINLAVEAAPQKCKDCGGTELVEDPDTLDTWFSSGTWTFSTLGWPDKTKDFTKFHPTQVLETGYDILFFWIARMILMTTYATGEVPFETVYLHGLVRDDKGRKMSKSLENIIDPLDVAEKYGTDAVRLSLVIGNTPGNDLKMSEDKIAYFRNFTNKLWNISRFIVMTCGAMKAPKSRPKPKTLADKWILGRLDETIASVTRDIEDFNFSRPGESLRDFTWNDLADWYLEIAKIEGKKEAMLSYLLDAVLKLWHPFMPFVTEEVHQRVFAAGKKDDFLMIGAWPKAGRGADKADAKDFGLVKDVIASLRGIRANYKVEPSKKIDAMLVAGQHAVLLSEHEDVIRGLGRAEKLEIVAKGQKPEKAAGDVVGGVSVYVPLGSLVDLGAEKKRLSDEMAMAEKYAASLEGKLANQDFVSRAPAQVVAAEREKLEATKDKIAKLKSQIGSL